VQILQEALESAVQEIPNQFLAQFIVNKLASKGITLSLRERQRLAKRVRAGGTDTFRLRRSSNKRIIQIDFTADDALEAEHRFAEFIEAKLPDLVIASAEKISKKILDDLKRTWRTESRRQKRDLSAFRERLYGRWGASIESLRMLAAISREWGARVNEDLRDNSRTEGRKQLIEVVTRSHARSCQITEEIVCLMAAGFADGAMARWRTMHEIAVTASLIAAHGEDLAERYVLHQVVESKRGADEYEKHRSRLGIKPLKKSEMKSLGNAYAALGKKFGTDFLKPYGWAAHHLKLRRPTFVDIEQAAGIDHLRPYYRLASHPVHANPKGVFFKLGMFKLGMPQPPIILAGPSNAGLADPGQCAAISLAQVSATLANLSPTVDTVVALNIIMQLVREISAAFGKAHSALEKDARKGSSVQLC
jgi:Family of unknown function (DUF5677)